MDAAAIADDLSPQQTAVAARVDGMKQLIDRTVSSVRRISADLRPIMLDNLGLAPTLEWLTRDFGSRTHIDVSLSMPDEELGASGDAATAIFRIVQEALTNVARHAQATRVTVEVLRSAGNVLVRVTDNGVGVSDSDERKSRSFGLLGMRERAYVLGGDFKINRTGQRGTTIEATIPAFGTVRGHKK
jgi:signal transduction histidine kinase